MSGFKIQNFSKGGRGLYFQAVLSRLGFYHFYPEFERSSNESQVFWCVKIPSVAGQSTKSGLVRVLKRVLNTIHSKSLTNHSHSLDSVADLHWNPVPVLELERHDHIKKTPKKRQKKAKKGKKKVSSVDWTHDQTNHAIIGWNLNSVSGVVWIYFWPIQWRIGQKIRCGYEDKPIYLSTKHIRVSCFLERHEQHHFLAGQKNPKKKTWQQKKVPIVDCKKKRLDGIEPPAKRTLFPGGEN